MKEKSSNKAKWITRFPRPLRLRKFLFWRDGAHSWVACKRADPQADILSEVEGLEREIDRLVYRLYEPTEEEIKIVEGQGRN